MRPSDDMPEQVKQLCAALRANADKVEGWDDEFKDTLLFVKKHISGKFEVSDNFERWGFIYLLETDGTWTTFDTFRREYIKTEFKFLMAEASIMYVDG